MSTRQKILLACSGLIMVNMFLFIVFCDNGLVDLYRFRAKKTSLEIRNENMALENIKLHRRIDRLKNDPDYIESVARNELGMIGVNDMIIKQKTR